MYITGSVMHDAGTIDAGAKAAMKITSIKARMVGINGLESVLKRTKWKLHRSIETNPRYIFFSIKKTEQMI
jgi:hypothetical protein